MPFLDFQTMNLIADFKKLIPFDFQIKSLYWVQVERQMDKELETIFAHLDNDEYLTAKMLIVEFDEKWGDMVVPNWLIPTKSQIERARAMLSFLTD
jgi:hypothetical protein